MSFELTTVGEYATIQGGYAFKSKDFKSAGNWRVLKIKNIRNGYVDFSDTSYVDDDIASSTTKWVTRTGDILISMTGSGPSAPESLVGRVAKIWKGDAPALINQRVGRLCLKNDLTIDPSFLFYLLSLNETQEYLVSNSTGSANQVNISSKTIESVLCPKIDFEHSVQIAAILGSLDERIRLLRETNVTLEAIAQAMFKSWFVDFDPVHAKQQGRAPEGMSEATAVLFPDSFEESELGLVPRGWQHSTVEQSFILTMGQSPPGDTYNSLGDGLPFYQGRTDFGLRFPTKRIFCNAPTRTAEIGDTLISVRAPVGDVNMAIERCCLGRGVASVRHPKGYRSFAFYAIRGLRSKFDMYDSEGTVFGSITKKDFQALPVIDPTKEVLMAFDDIAAPLDGRIVENEEIMRTLATLRDTLLPRLISGQLRLPDTADIITETLIGI